MKWIGIIFMRHFAHFKFCHGFLFKNARQNCSNMLINDGLSSAVKTFDSSGVMKQMAYAIKFTWGKKVTNIIGIIGIIAVTIFISSCSNSDDVKVLEFMEKGNQFLEDKNYSSALISFKDALKYEMSDESKAKNYRNIAVVFLYMENLDSAKYYSQLGADAVNSDSYYHLINKGEVYLLSNQTKHAIHILEQAKKLKPNEMEVYNNLSLIYAGNYGEEFVSLDLALSNAEKAYELNKNDVNKEQLASVYFQKENFSKALNLFKELYEKHPEVKMYQFYYGQSLYFSGNEELGIKMMEEAAERDENCRKLLEDLID
jgi:tetratricopeptide (TPR) repeat protein